MASALRTDWHCVEFTRTRGWELRGPSREQLGDFPSLLRWAAGRDIVTGVDLTALARRAAEHPDEAQSLIPRIHAMRDLVYRVLSPIGAGGAPTTAALEQLDQAWRSIALQRRVVPAGDGSYEWAWREVGPGLAPLDRVLWPVILSTLDLLTAPEKARVRLCSADDCGWLFIDASRNRSRRWCDMKDCGNRAKVRRFRQRRREARS